MKKNVTELEINGVVYVPKGSEQQKATKLDGMEYCVIRTYSAGVHTGYVESRDGKEVVLRNSRRIHYWEGAASLSQLAIDGVSKPDNCRFAMVLDKITLTEAIEVIPCTEKARKNIAEVPVWKK